jgi:hypothetical protein
MMFVLEIYDACSSTGKYYLLEPEEPTAKAIKEAIRQCEGIQRYFADESDLELKFEEDAQLLKAIGHPSGLPVGTLGYNDEEPLYLGAWKAEVGKLLVSTNR